MPLHASPPVLEYRGPDGQPVQPWSARKTLAIGAGVLLLTALIAVAIVVYLGAVLGNLDLADESRWPELWAQFDKAAHHLWQSVAAAPWYRWIEPIAWLLVLPAPPLLLRATAQRRLYIGDAELRMVSALPAWLDVGAWGSWTLRYQDIASVELVNYRAGRAYGPRPLQRAALQFKQRDGKVIQRVAVVPWHRPGEGVRPKLRSAATWLGVQLGTWNSAEDQQTLQRAYDALPPWSTGCASAACPCPRWHRASGRGATLCSRTRA